MGLESGSVINDLVITNPLGSDPKSAGDDHLRLIKTVLKQCFTGFTGSILVTATDTGTAGAHVLTPSTALLSYTTGLMLLYRPVNAGTGALTVNVSGLGAKNVKTLLGADPTSGDIVANQPILLMYDGTNFVIIAGSEMLLRTGNQTMTGNLTMVGTQAVTGDLSVSGTLSGPSMTAKGNVAGQAWTGAQDFTGATTTVATQSAGNSSTLAASTAFVAATAFASALPAQAGNAGKYVTTDGTNASWAALNVTGGASVVSSATSITLTSSSNRYQIVSMTAAGQSVNLPAENTLSLGGPAEAIRNSGYYTFNVVDSSGNIKATLLPGQFATFYVAANSVNGTYANWFVGNENFDASPLFPFGNGSVTATNAVAVINTAQNAVQGVALTSTKFLLAWMESSSQKIVSVIIDITSGNTINVGTPFDVIAAAAPAATTGFAICKLTSTTALAYYTLNSSGFPNAVVLSVSGSTLSRGTPLQITANAPNNGTLSACALSATECLLTAYVSSAMRVYDVAISGTTITNSGSGSGTANATNYVNITPISSTTAFLSYQDTVTTFANGLVVSVSAGTPTLNTAQNLSGAVAATYVSSCVANSTQAIVTWANGSTNGQAIIATISGTSVSITGNTVLTFKGSAITHNRLTWVGDRAIAGYANSSNFPEQSALTISQYSSGTLNVASLVNVIPTNSVTSTLNNVFYMGNGKVLSAWRNGTTTFVNAVVTDVLL